MPRTQESRPQTSSRLQDLEQSRVAVLNSLGSANSRRAYDYNIRKFIDWYCAEPRLGLNRSVVARYRSFLEQEHYSASTCARVCHDAGGELDQIQFLLGHVSVRTTERYLGCKQKLRNAVNDRSEEHT